MRAVEARVAVMAEVMAEVRTQLAKLLGEDARGGALLLR